MTALTTRGADSEPGNRIAEAILNFVGKIPGTAEKESLDPAQRARAVVRSAARKAAVSRLDDEARPTTDCNRLAGLASRVESVQ